MTHARSFRISALIVLSLVLLLASPAGAAKKDPPSTGGPCNPRKTMCTTDTTAPVVEVTTPSPGETVVGTVEVAGTSRDDRALAAVDVRVGDGPWQRATGTDVWTASVDASGAAGDTVTITARATDESGNAATTSIAVTVGTAATNEPPPTQPPADEPPPSTGDDLVLADPGASYSLLPLGRSRLPQWQTLTGVLYTEQFTNRRAIAFRDASSGATSYVDLPTDTLAGWTNAATVMTSAQDLWVFGGNGPMQLRHYRLEGSPLPTSATLTESRALGDGDSREGDMIALASGGLVLAWHQQGATGPQGQHVAYRNPTGAWQQLPALTFMPTRSSDQVLGQHPGDGSIWLFSNPDAWGAIGAAHLSEASGSLRVDWTDSTYLDTVEHGLNGPDPENPHLALAIDPARGTMHLAYQSADRQRFSDGTRSAIGSRIAIADVSSSGAVSFLVLPVWAERVSPIGLVVAGGEHVVSYRPIDEATVTFDEAHVRRHRAGTWEPAVVFGTMATTDLVTVASGRAELSARLSDGTIHLRTF